MKTSIIRSLSIIIISALFCKSPTYAQSGDQILDGIGETGLIARYIFDGTTKDWSRNNLHATLQNNSETYAADEKFKNVLSLSNGSYLSLPEATLNGIESLSITTWIYLNSTENNPYLFDFGSREDSHFFATPKAKQTDGFEAALTKNGTTVSETTIASLESKKWVHLAVVIDFPSQSFNTYLDGELAATKKASDLDLSTIFNADSNKLLIGNSLSAKGTSLDALLHDFRIYRIPLSKTQVARIYQNSSKTGETVVNERAEPEDNLPVFEDTIPQLYNRYLTAVSDVIVETVVGQLPRLPRFVEGSYKLPVGAPQVRVLWPAPEDNSSVLKPGTYTITGRVSGTDFKPTATVIVKDTDAHDTPNRTLEPFQLNEVSLDANALGKDSKFIENRDKFINTLAETNPDSFLYMFRNAFGQEQPDGAEPLGVWDTQETKLRGHATGHYLTAIAQAYSSTTYDKKLHQKFENTMNYMVNTLYDLSQLSGKAKSTGADFVSDPSAVPMGPGKSSYDSDLSETGIRTDYWNWGSGYISAYPPDQFIMLENGAKYGGQEDRVWAPYYTLHKILAGLIDVYEVSGNEKALEVAEGMAEWVHTRLSKLPTETLITMWNTYIAGEFGGINESLAHLYRITGKPEYLKTAQLFDNIKVFYGDAEHAHGLAKNVDTYRGLHANQHIPQIVGALELYRNSESPEYYHIADNFWYKTKNDYMYSIGGVAGARNPANAECFVAQPATLYENGLSAGGQNETCGTYNMLKLTRGLFFYKQQPELMDYYERALYNQILASVAEDSPANTYHIPLRPGSKKQFSNADMSGFTCCNGTALESSTKLQNSIYFKSVDNKALFVNLFVPSTLNWTEKDIIIKQETAFPHKDHSTFTIEGKGKFSLNIRIPGWAKNGVELKINGKIQNTSIEPDTYLNVERKWKNGDTVELKMPFSFHLDPIMDQENIASLFYGPVLLAAQESEPRTDFRKITLDASDLGKTISGNPEKLEFKIDGVVYKPFYETYDRHSVYLDVTLN
ncbi:beta-L-arabinofuranosidase domain-containing protein [Leeuwenhoekiella polynyae]|uniref:Beta-L-arabinofuranosidase n=1 Tax=Leeuwenhoekiella polynyae TaxID=1550906 RepID=A0A4Q0PEN7_9FLAO|nr:beta-L-arabinofuranosidase domain-containing protein [Leeuwenhoekiella polynyae]RXG25380.1 beta-L-arabinofuranosidase [Leeuwenhoekiella polynyae]